MANRQAHYLRRLERAGTDRDALWAACAWLVAEAVHAGRAGEATRAVLELVRALRDQPPPTAGDAPPEPGPDPSPAPLERALTGAQRAGVDARPRGRANTRYSL